MRTEFAAVAMAALLTAQAEVPAQTKDREALPAGGLVKVQLKHTDRVELGRLADWRGDTLILRSVGRRRSTRAIAVSDVDLLQRNTGQARYVAGGMLLGALGAAALTKAVPPDPATSLGLIPHALLAAIGGIAGSAIAPAPWRPVWLPGGFSIPPNGTRVRLTLQGDGTRLVGTVVDQTPDSVTVWRDGPIQLLRIAVADVGAWEESAGRHRPIARRAAQGAAVGALSMGLMLARKAASDREFATDPEGGGLVFLATAFMTTGALAGGAVGAVLGMGGTAEVWKPRGYRVQVQPGLGPQGAAVQVSVSFGPVRT
jgi:hypothetical protein